MKKNGFTLAEVLITLVIIGVISALAVPALIQNTQKQEYVSALKKAYSTLSQAMQEIIAEEGSPKGDGGWVKDAESVYNLFKQHLNVLKDCGSSAGCFNQLGSTANKGYKHLDKSTREYTSHNFNIDAAGRKLILADGVQIFFTSGGGSMYIDINGEKAPNQFGRDVFYFIIDENGLKPYCSGGCTNESGGQSCACKILTDGAMNY